jgi:endonuclease/exonuclease/phosphatase family metal-dependent hydrolase
MSTLRIATFNIWNKSGPWSSRLSSIRRELEHVAPAVLGLQEVLRYAPHGIDQFSATPANCQATEIAQGFGYEVAYAEAADYSNGLKFGNAVLSRFPIRNTRAFRLPGQESGETRSLLSVLLETPYGTLPVFVTHLNWKLHHGKFRLAQVKFIVDKIFEIAPPHGQLLPPVLLGDFNADPDADEIRFLRGLKVEDGKSVYFADAWLYGGDGSAGATFDRRNDFARVAREPSRRIDYVFVRGPDSLLRGEPLQTALCFATASESGSERVFPSDHFGVVSDISFAPRSP